MDFDDQVLRYFGTRNPTEIAPAAFASGMERLRVDFGLERDRGRRFALWALMHMLGNAPDLDIAFKTRDEQDAARDFMDLVARAPDTEFEPD